MKKIFDPTISIGNILTFIGMVVAIVVSWNSLTKEVAVMQYQISDLTTRVANINLQLGNRVAESGANFRNINLKGPRNADQKTIKTNY